MKKSFELPVVFLAEWKSKKNFEFVKSRVNNWSMCIGKVVLTSCRPS